MRFLCAALLLLLGTATASAEIRITESHYEDGKLTVTGQTQPNGTVTLDRKYKTESNGDGQFSFHLSYKPRYCMSDIRSGDDVYSAVISGCLGETQIAAPAKSTKLHG